MIGTAERRRIGRKLSPAQLGPAVAAGSIAAGCVALAGEWLGTFVGGALGIASWVLLRRARATPARIGADSSLPLYLDLVASVLRAGSPLPDALRHAAPALCRETAAVLARVAGLLQLGADPATAWAAARDGPMASVATVAIRSAASGIKLADALERTAADLRAERKAAAAARAQRAGVHALGPLAVCFLPAFACLGVVPVVVGVARGVLASVS